MDARRLDTLGRRTGVFCIDLGIRDRGNEESLGYL